MLYNLRCNYGKREPQSEPNLLDAGQLDVHEIMSILPHRYPFLLIDRVVEITRLKRIVAIKSVSINEPFFQGHFPGFAIMPGALVVEAIAQAGGVLLLPEVPDRDSLLMVFTGIDRAKFRRPVVPGDQLGSKWMCSTGSRAPPACTATPTSAANSPARPSLPASWCPAEKRLRRSSRAG